MAGSMDSMEWKILHYFISLQVLGEWLLSVSAIAAEKDSKETTPKLIFIKDLEKLT